VNLQLECEAMFLRKWTVPLMPPTVKASLGITDQPAAPTEGQPPAAQPAGEQQPAAPTTAPAANPA
jgi:hypothetical protein